MTTESISSKVREVLLRDWDPCCVGGNPNLKDEYDDYVPEIVALLLDPRKASMAEIEGLLGELERGLSLSLPQGQRDYVAKALLALNG